MQGRSLTLFALVALLFLGVVWYGSKPSKVQPTTDGEQGVQVAFTELARGDQSNVAARKDYLITTPEQMKTLWHLLSTSVVIPTVDFDRYQVVAVFAGKEPSAGYTISVTRVVDAAARDFTIVVNGPGPSCSAAQVVTTPYQVLLLPKTDLELTHTDVATTTSCWQ